MACQVRYLNSVGIHSREIKGADAIAAACPSHWLLYASLTCFPPNNSPIEMDVFLVTDEQIFILELKDWNGDVTQNGDRWFLGNKPRGRSPVALLAEKARKVKGIIAHNIPKLAHVYVDFRVVFTATANASKLSPADQQYCWNLAQTAALSTRQGRQEIIGQHKLPAIRPSTCLPEFERLFSNRRLFQPTEMDWDGYRISEENIFVHPKWAWREHRAEQIQDSRVKALLRIWNFEALPAGLNSPQTRRLVSDRERRVHAYLGACESWLVERSGILTSTTPPAPEVLTQHHEILSVPSGWTQLRRYLERNRDTISPEGRRDLVNTMIDLVSELHRRKVSHRDLGASCFWVGSPTRLGLTGLMSAQTPDDESVGNWLEVLRGYAPSLPEDLDATLHGTAQHRDVYQLGLLTAEIAGFTPPNVTGGQVIFDLAPDFPNELGPVLRKATSRTPTDRYNDAIAFGDAFGEIFVERSTLENTSGLDAHEVPTIPFLKWIQRGEPTDNGRSIRYLSQNNSGASVVVKVWPGIIRGQSPAIDLAMLAMFDGALRLKASPAFGLPKIEEAGLSRSGPYLVCHVVDGVPLSDFQIEDIKTALALIEQLCLAVLALHELGCAHADLSPNNILISTSTTGNTLSIIDLFDLSIVGDGRTRNLAYAPDGWETLSDFQIDRYAVLAISRELIAHHSDPRLETLAAVISTDLARDFIEMLEPLLESTQATLQDLARPATPVFRIRGGLLPQSTLDTEKGQLSLQVERTAGSVSYRIADTRRLLTVRVRDGLVDKCTLEDLPFWDLAKSARRSAAVPLRIVTEPGPTEGVLPLIAFLERHGFEPSEPAPTLNDFDIRDLWQRSVELESELMPEIRIRQRVGGTGLDNTYQYETDASFDFDEGGVIEARTTIDGRQRTVGQLDLNRLGGSLVTVTNQMRAFAPGDIVTLVDRRARVSIDRRRRAVDRIVRRESAIPDLLSFFDPRENAAPSEFELDPANEDLALYGLNPGQVAAFHHILQNGPVSLLQGPPGTGKTRFIAALIHWLVQRGGAKKVLLASQSHEGVNNAADELIKRFGAQGGRAHLLRIGAKGITERLRPFHTTSLRESYHNRFTSSLKARVAAAGAAIGVSRLLIYDLIDLDRSIGDGLRRIDQIQSTIERETLAPEEMRRLNSRLRALQNGISNELSRTLDIDPPPLRDLSSRYEDAISHLLQKHPNSTRADLVASRRLLVLSREWAETLQSGHRNFEEFLAKTRTVVAGTCVGLGQTRIRLEANSFDWVIVDEAARCTSSELAVPLQLGRRVLLVGDHLQLLPMLPHQVVAELREELPWLTQGEAMRSDFERAFTSSYGRTVGRVLHEQYRMDPKICGLVSDAFYAPHGVKLETSADRTPDYRFGPNLPIELASAITWLDTTRAPASKEHRRNNNKETWNDAEIDGIIRLLELISDQSALVAALATDEDAAVGIICMYKTQKERLESAFSQRPFDDQFRRLVKIDTVDAYQGKQNLIVIVSLVRNNIRFESGHVRSPNRCNVALSRARERLFIVGALDMWRDDRNNSPMQAVARAIVEGAGVVRDAGHSQ